MTIHESTHGSPHGSTPADAHAPSRRRLSEQASFRVAAAVLALFLVASTVPTPLYSIYQQSWGFSSTTLTGVFAIYSVGVLLSLLLLGSMSDHVGRRPVLVGAVVVEIVAMVVLAVAPGVGWLCAGRFVQGLATGVATSTSSGALLDFQKRGTNKGPTVNSLATSYGLAGGSLLAGLLAQFAPAPTQLAYFVAILGFALVLPAVLMMPEPIAGPRSLRRALRPQRPVVPTGRGVTFALMGTAILASWTVGSMFMALGPSVVRELLGGSPHLLGGLTLVFLTGSGGLAQLHTTGWTGARSARVATPLLITGLAAVAAAVLAGSIVAFFAGAIVLGVGWGLMFTGGLRMLTGLADPQRRAGVSATIYLIAYTSASVPSVSLGFVTTAYGLTTATVVFAVAASLFALLAFAGTFRRH
ncbi:MFS transporter [Parasphingorhabdus pacifica]